MDGKTNNKTIDLQKEAYNLGEQIRDHKQENTPEGLIKKHEQIQENNHRVKQLDIIQLEGRTLFEKKNKDYGDAFATYGPVGVLVRIGDKIQRLQNITSKGINLVDDESIRDTLIDLHNYAAMAIMLMDEKK
jgi:hypothetical protein|tara:strand:- start:1647 stop:2042 length:396 start_codon:yes stop_codon:yes gene_type:complete